MGLLVDGKWKTDWYATGDSGEFERPETVFRGRLTAEGGDHPAESDRYHLYVSYACPWAHRTLIVRALKGLDELVSVSVVHPYMGDDGWTFADDFPGATGDALGDAKYLRDVYRAACKDYTGRVTVPVLWDKKAGTIVNNESAEIIRMLDHAFDDLGARPITFYPADLRAEIDAVNADVYAHVNNGVYRCGFATTQRAYEAAYDALFDALDRLDTRLADRRYLCGERLTEADWRLFTTLVRFDAVYHGHFKCNRRRIVDYPNLAGYLRELYQVPGVAATVRLDHIKTHYYTSHETINPTRIVPKGPDLDLSAPHHRDHLPAASLL
ncbi:MAG: glutathione S-transferase family protein [Myxococcales bacterium]|nr:glutathione S-transferase family protein [Myxococcales bacterium]